MPPANSIDQGWQLPWNRNWLKDKHGITGRAPEGKLGTSYATERVMGVTL